MQLLPIEAQMSTVQAMLPRDFDGDGHVDLLLAGNFSKVPPLQGRYDASYGQLLRGDGRGQFTAVDMTDSKVRIEGDVKHLAMLRHAKLGWLVMVARNNETVQVLRAPR